MHLGYLTGRFPDVFAGTPENAEWIIRVGVLKIYSGCASAEIVGQCFTGCRTSGLAVAARKHRRLLGASSRAAGTKINESAVDARIAGKVVVVAVVGRR